MSDAIEIALYVLAGAVLSALGTLWFYSRRERSREEIIVDALARIETAVAAVQTAANRLAWGVQTGNDTGDRMEAADKAVAADLADSINRADAMPKDGNYGAAADAALRSGEERLTNKE